MPVKYLPQCKEWAEQQKTAMRRLAHGMVARAEGGWADCLVRWQGLGWLSYSLRNKTCEIQSSVSKHFLDVRKMPKWHPNRPTQPFPHGIEVLSGSAQLLYKDFSWHRGQVFPWNDAFLQRKGLAQCWPTISVCLKLRDFSAYRAFGAKTRTVSGNWESLSCHVDLP